MLRTAKLIAIVLATLLAPALAEASCGDEEMQPSTCHMTEQEGGFVTFTALLPSGLSYVELFARQNGAQNVAVPIQLSEEPVGEGLSLYGLTRGGYLDGDLIECRVYYYGPASPGQFGPGPGADTWEQTVYSEPNDAPRVPQAVIYDQGYGSVLFEVLLPSGQAFVEMVARTDGQVVLAQAVQLSEVPLGNGWSRYSLQRGGYSLGNRIELRVFSYLPASPGLFTPGPDANAWVTLTYGDAGRSAPTGGSFCPQ